MQLNFGVSKLITTIIQKIYCKFTEFINSILCKFTIIITILKKGATCFSFRYRKFLNARQSKLIGVTKTDRPKLLSDYDLQMCIIQLIVNNLS